MCSSDLDDRAEKKFPDQRINLDTGGSGRVSVSGLPAWDHASRFELEGEYRDPNGEIQTVHRSSNIYPSRVLLGIQPAGWAAHAEKVQFKVAAVSPDGKAVAGQPMKVSWIQKQTFSHRKRIVGGFYAYENFEEFRERGEACSGKTNEKRILECEVKAPVTGAVLLQAETQFEGKISRCHHEIYVAGSEDWWFSQENDDRIVLLPEKKNYEPGETARFQVRSPFREATALVTVEREGVIESFVREISGKNPVIEVPIRDSFAPNVFVSALLVRGRVGEPKPTALLDLGRPSHKLGIAKIRVAWKAHRLKVLVQSDRQDYRVREKVKVKVKVERELDAMPAAKGEVLLLAVDESLLELKKNDSWKIGRAHV